MTLVRPQRMGARHHREVDWTLFSGILFFGALILLAIYGPLLAPHDLYYSRTLIGGKAPPFPPSPDYLFGSDPVGRDRLSWILIGARGTIALALAAGALRMTIGASLGLVAGFRGGLVASILRRLALGLSSVPATIATLLAVIALNVSFEQFVLALAVTGWAEPFHQARRYARSEGARPFMESARSIGLTDPRLLLRHLLPNVAPALLTTAAFQVSAVLLLMAELALLGFFVGGAMIIDYDSRGVPIVAPRIPNWASMLALTRPIVSLYGDLAAVVLPGGALLGAVLATNLFGDALAARAQRLDVYRLFSRRQLLALVALALAVAMSVQAWPSRLAAEIEYAAGFDAARAVSLARDLAGLGPLVYGSTAANDASALLAQRLQGQVMVGTDVIRRVRESELRIADARLSPDAVTVLSIDDADVTGPLMYLEVTSLLGRGVDHVDGAIVVIGRASPAVLGFALRHLWDAGALAVVAVDMTTYVYRRGPGLYPIPTVRVSASALTGFLGHPLPDLRTDPRRTAILADKATLRLRTESVEARIANVVAHVKPISGGAPLVVVAAGYDSAPETTERWTAATAAATIVSIVDRIRATSIDVEILAVATSADHQNYAGLRLALANLDEQERARLQAILLIGPALSEALLVETQSDVTLHSGTGRLAARLHDAAGVAVSLEPAADLLHAIQSTGAAKPPLSFVALGPDREPAVQWIDRLGRTVLMALAYIPRHLDEMR